MFRKLIGCASAVGVAAAAVAWFALPAGASSAARTAASGTEHIQLMTTSPTSNTVNVIAYGVFTAAGVDHQGNTVDTLVFPGGSFKVRHSAGTGPQTFNPRTCLFTANQHGTYTVFGGTGKFKGISGHGTYQASILGIGAKSRGACSQTKPPIALQQVIKASGPVKL